ncbi:MAG: hypothetical protein WCQ70_02450 [Lentimicrobiaceae bacterium]
MKHFLLFLCALCSVYLLFPATELRAQCCSAGNPAGYDMNFANSGKNKFNMGLDYRYSLSNALYQGSKKINVGYFDKSDFNYMEFSLGYNITNKWSVKAQTGYFLNKSEYYRDFGNFKAYGLGDMMVMVNYQLFKSANSGLLVFSTGVVLPIGIFDQETDNVKLPVNVQPSSGSTKGTFSMYYQKSFSVRSYYYSLISLEVSDEINSENFQYHYGNVYLITGGINYKARQTVNLSLSVRADIRGKSYRDDHIKVESSGSRIVYLNPGVNWQALKRTGLFIGAFVPVYRYMNGIQAGNTIGFQAGLRINT